MTFVVLLSFVRPSCNGFIRGMDVVISILTAYAMYWWDSNPRTSCHPCAHYSRYLILHFGNNGANNKWWVSSFGYCKLVESFLICASGSWPYVTLNWLASIPTHATSVWYRFWPISVYDFAFRSLHVPTEDYCRLSPALLCNCSLFALASTCYCSKTT
jgi:hypothetical protein